MFKLNGNQTALGCSDFELKCSLLGHQLEDLFDFAVVQLLVDVLDAQVDVAQLNSGAGQVYEVEKVRLA